MVSSLFCLFPVEQKATLKQYKLRDMHCAFLSRDGNLKRSEVKGEWKERAQQDFAKKIM